MLQKECEFSDLIVSKLEVKFPNYNISVREVEKNNGVKHIGLNIISDESNVSPVIYLDNYWEAYLEGKPLDEVCDEIISAYETHKVQRNFDVNSIMDYDNVKNKICFKLVNTEKNSDYLDGIPHKEFLNLSMVYFVLLDENMDGIASVVVQKEMLNSWKVDVDELNRVAIKNAEEKLKGLVDPMESYLMGMLPLEESNSFETEESNNCSYTIANDGMGMYILTNKEKVNGSGLMLYPGVLNRLSKLLDSDLYILPSSTHELIALPCNKAMNPSDLLSMVQTINATEVSEEDYLADSVYYYSQEEDALSIAS